MALRIVFTVITTVPCYQTQKLKCRFCSGQPCQLGSRTEQNFRHIQTIRHVIGVGSLIFLIMSLSLLCSLLSQCLFITEDCVHTLHKNNSYNFTNLLQK